MADNVLNNVFRGPDSIINFFDPDLQPLLPLVELPAKLNPFRNDKVRIYAKMLTATPAQNVKVFPGNRIVDSFGEFLLRRQHSPEHVTS